jgi:TPP-dependent pyruvate/acetoin dehydrogenase alpha subunit
LITEGLIDGDAVNAIRNAVIARFEVAVEHAKAAPLPTLADLETDVFAIGESA